MDEVENAFEKLSQEIFSGKPIEVMVIDSLNGISYENRIFKKEVYNVSCDFPNGMQDDRQRI